MRLGEAVLAIAGGAGGWLVTIALALTLAVVPSADCAPGDDALWSGTAVFGVVGALGAWLAGVGVRQRASLRWLALTALPLVAFDLAWIAPAIASTSLGDASLCARSELAPSAWERAWPPIQTLALLAALAQAWRYWRPREAGSTSATSAE